MTPRCFHFMKSWTPMLALGISGGLLVGLLVGATMVVLLDLRMPVQMRDIREVDGVAVRGRRLDLLIRLDRAHDCINVTTRFLWTWTEVDGERIQMFVPLGSATMGVLALPGKDKQYVLSVPLPSDLAEGDWFYRSRAVDTCPGLFQLPVPVVRETPDVPVRIVASSNVPPLKPYPTYTVEAPP